MFGKKKKNDLPPAGGLPTPHSAPSLKGQSLFASELNPPVPQIDFGFQQSAAQPFSEQYDPSGVYPSFTEPAFSEPSTGEQHIDDAWDNFSTDIPDSTPDMTEGPDGFWAPPTDPLPMEADLYNPQDAQTFEPPPFADTTPQAFESQPIDVPATAGWETAPDAMAFETSFETFETAELSDGFSQSPAFADFVAEPYAPEPFLVDETSETTLGTDFAENWELPGATETGFEESLLSPPPSDDWSETLEAPVFSELPPSAEMPETPAFDTFEPMTAASFADTGNAFDWGPAEEPTSPLGEWGAVSDAMGFETSFDTDDFGFASAESVSTSPEEPQSALIEDWQTFGPPPTAPEVTQEVTPPTWESPLPETTTSFTAEEPEVSFNEQAHSEEPLFSPPPIASLDPSPEIPTPVEMPPQPRMDAFSTSFEPTEDALTSSGMDHSQDLWNSLSVQDDTAWAGHQVPSTAEASGQFLDSVTDQLYPVQDDEFFNTDALLATEQAFADAADFLFPETMTAELDWGTPETIVDVPASEAPASMPPAAEAAWQERTEAPTFQAPPQEQFFTSLPESELTPPADASPSWDNDWNFSTETDDFEATSEEEASWDADDEALSGSVPRRKGEAWDEGWATTEEVSTFNLDAGPAVGAGAVWQQAQGNNPFIQPLPPTEPAPAASTPEDDWGHWTPHEPDQPTTPDISQWSPENIEVIATYPLDRDKGLMLVRHESLFALMGQTGGPNSGQVAVIKTFDHNPLNDADIFGAQKQGEATDKQMYLTQIGHWQALLSADAQSILLHTELC